MSWVLLLRGLNNKVAGCNANWEEVQQQQLSHLFQVFGVGNWEEVHPCQMFLTSYFLSILGASVHCVDNTECQ